MRFRDMKYVMRNFLTRDHLLLLQGIALQWKRMRCFEKYAGYRLHTVLGVSGKLGCHSELSKSLTDLSAPWLTSYVIFLKKCYTLMYFKT